MGPRRLPFRIRMILGGCLLSGGLASWHPASDARRPLSSPAASFSPPVGVLPERRPSATASPSGWTAELKQGDDVMGGRERHEVNDNRTATKTPDGDHIHRTATTDDSSNTDAIKDNATEASDPEPDTLADFDAPGFPWQPSWVVGRSLRTEGRSIHVAGFQPVPGATAPGLDILITEEPSSIGPTAIGAAVRSGFSREEALFRMRWGWAAYEAARHAAREEQL